MARNTKGNEDSEEWSVPPCGTAHNVDGFLEAHSKTKETKGSYRFGSLLAKCNGARAPPGRAIRSPVVCF